MSEQDKTRLIPCPKCGLRTAHEWQKWNRWPFLSRLIGRLQGILIGGWVCSPCGHRIAVRRIEAQEEADQP
jgi:DNA-directed RNA polymerase subunit RPC12/RpoP